MNQIPVLLVMQTNLKFNNVKEVIIIIECEQIFIDAIVTDQNRAKLVQKIPN